VPGKKRMARLLTGTLGKIMTDTANMKHFKLILILIISISCTSNQHDKKVDNVVNNNSKDTDESILQTDTVFNLNHGADNASDKVDLYLNGIYEFAYPYNTDDLIENHYIAFRKTGENVEGWYYGTSDEFDEAREGYLPGFFVSKIQDLETKGDSLLFKVLTGYNKCYSKALPIGYVVSSEILKTNEIWQPDNKKNYTLDYSGKLTGLKITMAVNGNTRVFKKRKNYFHVGIDNFDKTKCQSEPLLAITKNIDSLNDSLILDFLETFSVTCENNVEFSEWSNELLFKVMAKQPERLIKIFADNISELDTAAIFKEIESPIHDLIDIEQIRNKIASIDIDKDVKDKIIKRLENK
jgi:hypothetical protein